MRRPDGGESVTVGLRSAPRAGGPPANDKARALKLADRSSHRQESRWRLRNERLYLLDIEVLPTLLTG